MAGVIRRLCLLLVPLVALGCDRSGRALAGAREVGTVEAFEAFLEEYPDHVSAPEVVMELAVAMERSALDGAPDSRRFATYEAYFERYSGGALADAARQGLDGLRIALLGFSTAVTEVGPVIPPREDRRLDEASLVGVVLQLTAARSDVTAALSREATYAIMGDGRQSPLLYIQPIDHADANIQANDVEVYASRPYGGTRMTMGHPSGLRLTSHGGFISRIGEYRDGDFLPYAAWGVEEGTVFTYGLPEGQVVKIALLFEGTVDAMSAIVLGGARIATSTPR